MTARGKATTTRSTRSTRSATKTPSLDASESQVKRSITPSGPVAKKGAKTRVTPTIVDHSDREAIRAYLRIRPQVNDDGNTTAPYLRCLSQTTVQMADPIPSRIRMNHTQQALYTFTSVFPPETPQADFFTNTTLPLVNDLLGGQNGLIFTYGVTNSGKTYTIQGGSDPSTSGILPRTLDVVFNSLEGLHSDRPFKPTGLAGVAMGDPGDGRVTPEVLDKVMLQDVFGESSSLFNETSDSTSVQVDKNYEYSVWVSYAEVYNEKIYDLLSEDAGEQSNASNLPRTGSNKKLSRSTSTWQSIAALTNSSSQDVLLLKRKALSLKSDPDGGKYIVGLREIQVRTAAEAKSVFRTGKINRRVFGTLANSVSSRSHSVFTVKILRIHKGSPEDLDSVTSSRLSIVDLAGSERSKNTQNTGDRLKEAGNINKSLMVLGQCMEALRNNQKRIAASLAAPGRGQVGDTRLGLVPFRHSKLTELFQDLFTGERGGRVVMIVNVNPYDTGFDENSHVMKFAALTREVMTATAPSTPRPKAPMISKAAPQRRTVTFTGMGGKGVKCKEAHLEVVEEDEDPGDGEDAEPINPLVDALFDEIEELRVKLFESEMRCAVIEAEIREEVMKEMNERMIHMEGMFARRLQQMIEQNEMRTDAKIDMLHRFGAFSAREKAERKSGANGASSSQRNGPTAMDVTGSSTLDMSMESVYLTPTRSEHRHNEMQEDGSYFDQATEMVEEVHTDDTGDWSEEYHDAVVPLRISIATDPSGSVGPSPKSKATKARKSKKSLTKGQSLRTRQLRSVSNIQDKLDAMSLEDLTPTVVRKSTRISSNSRY